MDGTSQRPEMNGKFGITNPGLEIVEEGVELGRRVDEKAVGSVSVHFDPNIKLADEEYPNPDVPTCASLKPTRLKWENLTYEVIKKQWVQKKGIMTRKVFIKQILKRQSGEISSGTLTAVMGPSGAGKSTLLNSFSGRITKGVDGAITITTRGAKPRVSLAFVPQKDDLFEVFTVKETLLFASKMKNRGNVDHEAEVVKVLKQLNLDICAKTIVGSLSGGQLKRACIGVELISNPDVLILDEPTTGLDSSTAAQCIQLLRRLTESAENPPAIVATIHQPNYKIFCEFHKIYVLSRTGQNIYFGSPSKLVDHFAEYGLICPSYCNPADYVIEVAYGDYGQDCFDRLEKGNTNLQVLSDSKEPQYKISTVIKKMRNQKLPFLTHTGLLFKRAWSNSFRDSNQFWLKIIQNVIIITMVSYLWEHRVGENDGCWDSLLPGNGDGNLKELLFTQNVTQSKDDFVDKIGKLTDNSILFFSCCVYILFVSITQTVLSFPSEASVVTKEIDNNWFKVSSYFWAKTLADIPTTLVSILVLPLIFWPLTGQINEAWRMFASYGFLLLEAEVCQTIGIIFGILFSSDLVSATVLSIASGFPVILFGGLFVRYSGLPWFYKPMSFLSYMRHTFEGLVITIYGFGRCEVGTATSLIDDLVKAKDPQKMMEIIFKALDINVKDSGRFSALLGADQTCVSDVINQTSRYLLGTEYVDDNDVNDYNGVLGINDVDDYNDTLVAEKATESVFNQPSYVLSYYELNEVDIMLNVSCLIAFVVVLKFITYGLLKYKTRPKH